MRRLSRQEAQLHREAALAAAAEVAATVELPLPDPAVLIEQERQEAQDRGYRDGLARGTDEAKQKAAARSALLEAELRKQHEKEVGALREAREVLSRLAIEIEKECERLVARAEETAVEAAYAGVLKVLGKHAAEGTLMRDLCLHAMTNVEQTPTALRVSVEDKTLLGEGWAEICVIGDARLAPGQCTLETRMGHYEAGLDVRLEVLKEAFLEGLQRHRGDTR